MRRKAYQTTDIVTIIFVVVAFLSIAFFTSADLSFAASEKEKSSATDRTSAVNHAEARIKELQGVLKITIGQNEAWNNLTKVMLESAKEMDILTRDKNDAIMNAVEHMQFHRQISEAHLVQLKKFIPPFDALYATMSDEQKKNTDILFRTALVWQNWAGA